MWTSTRVSHILQTELPILQGPFGGGPSTPALVAAVSNAGGLGGLGAVGMPPEDIVAAVAAIRGLTDRPFAINLWLPIPGQDDRPVSDADLSRGAARLRRYFDDLGVEPPPRPERFVPEFDRQLEAVLQAKPPAFSFIMGVPDPAILKDARARGIVTIGTATTVDEAVAIEAAGADLVVASGADAGGHRASFLRSAEESLVGTFSLVPQIADAVAIPVIAAGGIADGRGVAAALALGAEGVQIGTALLAAPESGAPDAHKRRLGTPASRWTRLTRVFSGRLSRGLASPFMDAYDRHEEEILPFPAQSWLTAPLRRAGAQQGRADVLALWAGQHAAAARARPAAETIAAIVEETDKVLRTTRLEPQSRRVDEAPL